MEKKIIAVIILFVLVLNLNAFADRGAPIPIPKYSVTEATKIAQEFFYQNFPYAVLDSKDFILTDAVYTKYAKHADGNELPDWAWVITFTHPIVNDHSFKCSVDNNGKTRLLSISE